MVMSWLLHSIDKQLVSSLVYCATLANLWIELETRFQQSNQTQIFGIKCDLATLTQDNLSVTQYYGRLKTLLEELASLQFVNPCTCVATTKYLEIQSANQVYQFLMGLDETYHQLCSQILAIDSLHLWHVATPSYTKRRPNAWWVSPLPKSMPWLSFTKRPVTNPPCSNDRRESSLRPRCSASIVRNRDIPATVASWRLAIPNGGQPNPRNRRQARLRRCIMWRLARRSPLRVPTLGSHMSNMAICSNFYSHPCLPSQVYHRAHFDQLHLSLG